MECPVSKHSAWLVRGGYVMGQKGRRAGCAVSIAEALEPGPGHCLHHLPLRLFFLRGFQGFSPLPLEAFFLYSHILRNGSHLLFLRVTAHLCSDLLFADLPFESHRQSGSHVLGRNLTGYTKYRQQNPQRHFNCKSFFLCCSRILSYVSAKQYSRNQAPPPFIKRKKCIC